MKKYFLLAMLSLTLMSCERQDRQNNSSTKVEDVDNTGINVRDRDSTAITSGDQSENAGDRVITQKIRQAIVSNNSLSLNAKNIKIVTINGVVTLRGPVDNAREREIIGKIANDTSGILRVDNLLEITKPKNNP